MMRFLLTGAFTNGVGYGVFLIAVYVFGIGHKTTATFLFVIGVTIGFTLNKNWTFKSKAPYSTTLFKYLAIYISGYFINILFLYVFVDYLGYEVGWSQFIAIGFLTIYYFVMNKFFIFRRAR